MADQAEHRRVVGAAIDAAVKDFRANDPGVHQDMILTEWIVVAAARGYRDDGEPVTQVFRMPDGESPPHHLKGLLVDALDAYRQDGDDDA